MAPEVYGNLPYTTAVDVFSLGCMMFLMLLGKLPFRGKTWSEIGLSTCADDPDLDKFHMLQDEELDLIMKVCRLSPFCLCNNLKCPLLAPGEKPHRANCACRCKRALLLPSLVRVSDFGFGFLTDYSNSDWSFADKRDQDMDGSCFRISRSPPF